MAYYKNKSAKTLTGKQIQYIQETVPNIKASERLTTEDADIIHDAMLDDLLNRGFDEWYNLNKYGWLAQSIMDFIEDNYPELFGRDPE